MAIKNVALIGASGTLGPSILTALNGSPYKTFVLNRASSKSKYPNSSVITIPDDLDVQEVTKRFNEESIDALILAISGAHVDAQKKLIDAAFASKVQLVMPAEFGSCDSADERSIALMPLYTNKRDVRDYLVSFEQKERNGRPKLTWTALVTGHFFDWGLENNLLRIDINKKIAHLADGGNVKFSASNLSFIAKAVVKVLGQPEGSKNTLLYVHSNYLTQLELLAAIEKETGEKFERVNESSAEVIKQHRPKMLEGDHEAYETTVAVWGIVSSDWIGSKKLANGLLGLEEEKVEEVVRRAVQNVKAA
ncbi:NAD(P)-binding protein [Pleomassaria siparia CBS 279.74]|uniref:NAD(P)-binding protein n=1 Tax=Pleomassaria siparia CBS 279.74 TaxID=1314801 RepID=A0A6G1K9Y1_9PLEO|nr:NAD(P)-binding protein [Pleomassaria siparia CBS 279.74]